jgi:branched-chain amino acid transport system ATP-binding protein
MSEPLHAPRAGDPTPEPARRAGSPPLLETRSLTIAFGGHIAVNAVSCAFTRGSLTAIVGPNGAGKTTYLNLISGQLRASAGDVVLDGQTLGRSSAAARTRRGLGRAFQLTNLFPNLSVRENVRLAAQARAGGGLNVARLAERDAAVTEQARRRLAEVQLEDRADVPAAALSHGDQRKLEVALLLALQPEVFLFDEPTAGMSLDEVPVVLDLIERIKAQGDKCILLVEHKMDVVRRLADRVIVLHQGSLLADGDPAAVIASPLVQEAYLGRSPAAPGNPLRSAT